MATNPPGNGGNGDGRAFSPFDPLSWFRGGIDRWFEEFAPGAVPATGRNAPMPAPAVDVVETPDSYEVWIEIPGMDAGDIEVRAAGSAFHILGEKRNARPADQRHYRFAERRYGRFERTIPLPADSLPTEATAHYENGVLRLQVPRSAGARADVKIIPVTSAKG